MKGGEYFMTKSNLIRVLGAVGTIVTIAASLLSNWVDDQKMNEKIDEKVNEALAKRDEKEDEES